MFHNAGWQPEKDGAPRWNPDWVATFARKHKRPFLRLSWETNALDPAEEMRWFLKEHGISILNVAGPRGSKEPDVYDFAKNVLTATVRQ